MTKTEAVPYYQSFCQWLGFTRPDVAFRFTRGQMGVSDIQPHIRQWAEDITDNG